MNDKVTPLVSVILPVFNGETYLSGAIDSILQQTYPHFELIIVNDGSTDGTAAIIDQFSDSRIVAHNQPNQGLSRSLNNGISFAKGSYIARQDHDDISLPERFEKQVKFLETHPQCAMVGTRAEIQDDTGQRVGEFAHPCDYTALRFELLFDNPFVHSSIMFRKSILDEVGLYSTDPERQPPEDYELWSRVARKYQVANIPEFLVVYRRLTSGICHTRSANLLERITRISAENIAWYSRKRSPDRNVFDLASIIHKHFEQCIDPRFVPMALTMTAATIKAASYQRAFWKQPLVYRRYPRMLARLARNYVIYKYLHATGILNRDRYGAKNA